jgi:hypothetical protein
MGKARFWALVALILAALAGCGGGSDSDGSDSAQSVPEAPPREVPGDADPEAVAVIGAWVDALRDGDVEAAAGYFAIPSIVENGPIVGKIETAADAVDFNKSLPCGARLVRAETSGEFTTASFQLTERPGRGVCGQGTGQIAKTAFVIQDGLIAEWRRVGAGGAPTPESEGEAA